MVAGRAAEAWLIHALGKRCLGATRFEDKKLGVDLWVFLDGKLVPIQITISDNPDRLKMKWCVAVRRGIVFIKLSFMQILKDPKGAIGVFWSKFRRATKAWPVFLKKEEGGAYQPTLPWFNKVARRGR